MTLEQLNELKSNIEKEISLNHEASSEERDKVLSAVTRNVESYFNSINIKVSWAWLNYEYTKDWDKFTLKTHIDFTDNKGNSQKPDIFAEVNRVNNEYQVTYLKVGEDVLIENTKGQPANNNTKNDKSKKVTIQPVKSINITAKKLMDEYENNEIKADKKYKGNLITITGKVVEVTSSWGTTTVEVGTGELFEWGIRCQMSRDQEDIAADLDKGDSVKITGVCDGKSILMISLKDCYFEK